MSHILTVEQAADMLQMNPQVVREYLRKGMLPGRKIGRHWRLLEEDLAAFIRGGQPVPEQPKPSEEERRWDERHGIKNHDPSGS